MRRLKKVLFFLSENANGLRACIAGRATCPPLLLSTISFMSIRDLTSTFALAFLQKSRNAVNFFLDCNSMVDALVNHSKPYAFSPQHIDAAIIDLDGTLVDTLGDFVAALELMQCDLSARGFVTLPLKADRVVEMVGKGAENLVKSALDHLNSLHAGANKFSGAVNSPTTTEFALTRFLAHYKVISGQHAALYPGVLAGLRACRTAGLPLACVTNKPLAFAQPLLRHLGLDEFFSLVYGGDSFARKKPDPLPLLKTCEALGTLPARTLMVGDSSNDAKAARAAGCPVVLVTYGYNHGQPVRAVDADGWFDSLADLFGPAALTAPV